MDQINYSENDGYKVIQMWECEWETIKDKLSNKVILETQPRHQNINPRDVFFGDKIESFKKYHKCRE